MLDSDRPSLDPLRFPQRKSVRLKDHDYSDDLYFITICVWNCRPLLSSIRKGRVFLTPIGQIVEDEWIGTNQIRRNAWVDTFVVMPNHFHGIVGLGAAQVGDGAGSGAHAMRPYLGKFVAGFKSACTRRYREITGDNTGPLWQRGYYEHVIRGRCQLYRIRRYIAENPRKAHRLSATECSRSAFST